MEPKNSIDTKLLSLYGKNDLKVWENIKGERILHNKDGYSLGWGQIDKIYRDTNGEIYFKVKYDKVMEFNITSITKLFDRITVSTNIRQKIYDFYEQIKLGKYVKYHNDILAVYNLSAIKNPPKQLYNVLLELLMGHIIEDNDVQKWLERTGNLKIFSYMGKYFKERIPEDYWNIVKAGKYFRKAKQPDEVLELTKNINKKDNRFNSALFANRGGAYCDKGEWIEGKECALNALRYNNVSFRAWRLLGRISKNDEHFEIAEDIEANKPGKRNITINDIIIIALDNDNLRLKLNNVFQNLIKQYPKTFGWIDQRLRKI
jgi:hypothetical protein